jgi:lactoylglutathione lyase
MTNVLLNIDVDDITRAIRFYTEAFGLRVGRRFGEDFLELMGAPVPIYLLANRAGTAPFSGADGARTYTRHWSPLHLDFVVDDMELALARAERAGATREGPVRQEPYGLLATLSDPFGHGFCLLEFRGPGYDALLSGSR